MTFRSFLRPRRSLVFPFAAVLSPIIWFVLRNANRLVDGEVRTVISAEMLAVAGGAVVVSYVVATVVGTVVYATGTSAWKRWLFAPSNEVLGLFAAVSLGIGVQLLDWVVASEWLGGIAGLLGVVVGWPLLFVYGVTVVAGSALVGQQVFAVEAAAVAVGIALSVAWQFVLFGWLTDVVGRLVGTSVRSHE